MRLSFVAGWRENPIPGALIHEVPALVTPSSWEIGRKPDNCSVFASVLARMAVMTRRLAGTLRRIDG